MRVTSAVREYVKKMVLAKVANQLKAAEDAKEAAVTARDAKVDEARKLCEKMCAETQAKFVKEVKKLLNLTFIPDSYGGWKKEEIEKGGNIAIEAIIGPDDFIETLESRNNTKAKCNPCAERDEFDRIIGEPSRITNAANAVADKLLFELELGKVAKGELDGLLNELEVKV